MNTIARFHLERLFFFALFFFGIICTTLAQPGPRHDLNFESLATTWDEGIPLGNGMVGALIWQKKDHLRMSLDRADLWDQRPMKGLHRPEFSYKWVQEQVKKKEYGIVQQYFDVPYDKEPGPSKIPGGALEFDIQSLGKVQSVHLSLKEAVCTVKWENGMVLKTFVHATQPVGWFRFENLKNNIIPKLVAPTYQSTGVVATGGPVEGDDLSRLGYKQGTIKTGSNTVTYEQEGWGGFKYQVSVTWKKINNTTVEGAWSISSQYPGQKINPLAKTIVDQSIARGYNTYLTSHNNWWKEFWSKSAIHVPDTLLEKQWYLEQYKFGAAARRGAPPISLQAVWTADNGRLPPWKGDFHHDLNTQLSYWPAYSGNHLEEALGYIDHLEQNKANYKRYSKLYFGSDGLAVPGVTTLDGTEMGGWIQYSLSPTVSAWLGHHYYLQWRYSMDRRFLKEKAYPWISDVARHLEQVTIKDKDGFRKLPISSSPEIHDNSINAWFNSNTNYDLALMRFTFGAAAELAAESGLKAEASHWKKILSEFRDFAVSENNELLVSSTLAYKESHRHFSHMMAIYPLSLITWEKNDQSKEIIQHTIALLNKIGPDYWCGYSYSWLASMNARAKNGAAAAKALQIFAKAFCLKNSFHVNGDQTKSGYSKFVYRPFTLEGNFAFASGLQEMLLQSYAGFIEVMPAVPDEWQDISFDKLRAEGAFLISAEKSGGRMKKLKIVAEAGGTTKLKLPFKNFTVASKNAVTVGKAVDGFVELSFKKGGELMMQEQGD
ncbi:glycosyl hydrolase family 95 catalytic domain-containing protein [Chitinophaga sp. MM2321]|uniref:glycosyl hydrolase family 95 catalytic domain-containing protein n=1 Tax=Chitinophaga sp. MM2321 TaxID=3137178 RepID=UPI0032D5A893